MGGRTIATTARRPTDLSQTLRGYPIVGPPGSRPGQWLNPRRYEKIGYRPA